MTSQKKCHAILYQKNEKFCHGMPTQRLSNLTNTVLYQQPIADHQGSKILLRKIRLT